MSAKVLQLQVIASERVGWFAELIGEYQYTLAFYSRDSDEIDNFLLSLTEDLGGEIASKALATRVRWAIFRPKYLFPQKKCGDALECLSLREKSLDRAGKFDLLDHNILKLLAQSTDCQSSQIARKLHVAPSTVIDRLDSLRSKGIFLGHAARWDSQSFGISRYRILLFTGRADRRLAEELFNFSCAHSHITTFVQCLGSWDFELSFELEDPERLPKLVQEIQDKFGKHLRDTRAVGMLKRHKACLYPFQTSLLHVSR